MSMNNDLDQFSENMLEKMAVGDIYPTVLEQAALARIALAAKQAKPVALVVIDKHTDEVMLDISDEGRDLQAGDALYTTPQPAHTEQVKPPVISEWSNAQCLEFLSVAFRHNDIYGEISVEDIRLGVKFALAAAPKPENKK